VPSAFTHAVAATALGCAFRWKGAPAKFWIAGMACAVAPDLDSIGFAFGVRYGDLWGHRGLTHSLAFALVLALLVASSVFRKELRSGTGPRVLAYLFLASASHGILDGFTNGGLGVAFLSPFDPHRYFFPWRPLEVSPINVRRFLHGRGLEIIRNEALWVGLPSVAFAAAVESLRLLNPAYGRSAPSNPR
jgi:inner membrane protein